MKDVHMEEHFNVHKFVCGNFIFACVYKVCVWLCPCGFVCVPVRAYIYVCVSGYMCVCVFVLFLMVVVMATTWTQNINQLNLPRVSQRERGVEKTGEKRRDPAAELVTHTSFASS